MSADRTLVDADAVALTVAVLSRRFPGATVWYGLRTRHWWAVIRASGRWCLIEAACPDELTRAVLAHLRTPVDRGGTGRTVTAPPRSAPRLPVTGDHGW